MARPRKRVRLEDGLKFDINEHVRRGFWPRADEGKIVGTQWLSRSGAVTASAITTTKIEAECRGSFTIRLMGRFEQRLELTAQPRHFGGLQWYFVCPVTGSKCSVVWLPPGADRFCSRQAWGKQVAYSTQFESPFDRAITAREKVKSRLIGNLNRREWELPPKPKWMRWDTYECLVEKYQFQQDKIDQIMADYLR
jgi:hypothetical protein